MKTYIRDPSKVKYEYKYNGKPTLFMMMGLSACGKSYTAENLVVRNGDVIYRPIIHSSDELRKELYGDENDQEHNQEVFLELHRRIKDDLRSGFHVVYDSTNINKNRRKAFLGELSRIDCQKVCVCVVTPYDLCLSMNQSRDRKVPENVIRKMYLSWCPPDLNEGFDDIIVAYNFSDNYAKDKFTIFDFFFGEIGAIAIDQENKHHSSTVGEHCIQAAKYIKQKYPDDRALIIAALLHDIGKPFTKSHLNSRGETDVECHYYNHNNCGAYDSLLYMQNMDLDFGTKLRIANLIYFHMHPFLSWDRSEKSRDKAIRWLGQEFYDDVMKLHEADLAAH